MGFDCPFVGVERRYQYVDGRSFPSLSGTRPGELFEDGSSLYRHTNRRLTQPDSTDPCIYDIIGRSN